MSHRPYLLSGLASVALIASATASPAYAQQLYDFDIPSQDLGGALRAFARTSGVQVIFDGSAMRGKRSARYRERAAPEAALQMLLRGTGMNFRRDGGIYVIVPENKGAQPIASSAPTPAPAAPPPVAQDAVAEEDEIIVTAQKREERITDVPIAITALSSRALDDRKIEGGSELLRAVPNVSFSKTNFSMYNFSIRGIGTQSISASSDPAVAVSFNSTPLVRNRLFESEFFDLERVEVLRGPQGTLYGRNATAGVVNMIPALPGSVLEGSLKLEVGNYDTMRATGMLNVPLTDSLAVRVAGAWTSREGFDYNTFTGRRINDRNLWSTRASLAWEPSDRFRANLIWQHFEEDDNRSRTGKQLCTTDPGPARVGNVAVTNPSLRGRLSQGCLPGSLYDDAAFSTPNGASLVYLYYPSTTMTVGTRREPGRPNQIIYQVKEADPFAGVTQSRNLREISSNYEPVFRAKNDVVQLNLEFRPTSTLQFISQTAFSRDRFYSTQDYNRYVTVPLFSDSAQPNLVVGSRPIDSAAYPGPTPGGIFCDPQLGCSDRMVSADLSRSRNRQWSQEFRLQSSFDGPLNFIVGANYLDFKSQDDYYVFNNMFTLIAQWNYSRSPPNAQNGLALLPCPLGFEMRECPYVDPNPIGNLDNQGHNYFLSQNGVRIRSKAVFGEVYWEISDSLKLTLGARYTNDNKRADQVPSQLLLAGGTSNPSGPRFVGNITGGRVNSGYPALDDIVQSWGRFTGRAVLDWKPKLGFTDDTLIYLSAARGYKGGGVNPPRVDFNPAVVQYQYLPQTFRPEYVNAFEVGIKNSFDGGRFTLNGTGFFYDYKDYQVSQIVDRIAFNENFNATSWGLELEAAWRPSRAFRVDGNLGYLRTRLGKGSQSIDVMNRTQGNPDWVVLRPWLQVPSNCVAPRAIVEKVLAGNLLPDLGVAALCPGADRVGSWNPARTSNGPNFWNLYGITYDPLAPYNPATVGLPIAQGGSGAPNGGRGFYADLSGNELPNAPRVTFNFGAQYTFFIDQGDWELTVRGDYYRQSKSFGRIYNTTFDRLRGWDNVNAAITLVRPASDLTFQLYVKNLFDKTPLTGFFTNSDDTGLTTNVFTVDPRIIGFNVSKKF
jgi:iron complex outermembrane recepter protein